MEIKKLKNTQFKVKLSKKWLVIENYQLFNPLLLS